MENLQLKKPSSNKERNLIKGALRRVFSRSELRRQAQDAALLKDYHDPSRKRVTRWGKCSSCQKLEPLYLLVVDHKEPVVPIDSSLDEMDWNTVVDRLWCDEKNLQAICKPCHHSKSALETKERAKIKKLKKGDNK